VISATMTSIITPDIGRAVAFYRDLMGLPQAYQHPPDGPPRHIELSAGESRIGLSSYPAAQGVGLPDPGPGHPVELVFHCEDVDAEVARLEKAGTTVLVRPYDHVASHRRATVTDPDGNWVSLVATC
jgi:predicted enzyme related to lactoylglutathione lyase